MIHLIYLSIIFVLFVAVCNLMKEFRHWHTAYMNSRNDNHGLREHIKKLNLEKEAAEEDVKAWKKVLSDFLGGLERAFRIGARKYINESTRNSNGSSGTSSGS